MMRELAATFGHRAQPAHLAASHVIVTRSADERGESVASVRLTSRLHSFRLNDQTPWQDPHTRHTDRMISAAEFIAMGEPANGPDFSEFSSRSSAALKRSRQSFRTFGLASCPTSTKASASIPGSCGTTIAFPPDGVLPLWEQSKHTHNEVSQRHFGRVYGRFIRNLSQSWHSEQPKRITLTASARSSSASASLETVMSPVITGATVPCSSMAISRLRRDRQRRAEPLVLRRDRAVSARISASVLKRRESYSDTRAMSHVRPERHPIGSLRQTVFSHKASALNLMAGEG